jgi:hypothetical protein
LAERAGGPPVVPGEHTPLACEARRLAAPGSSVGASGEPPDANREPRVVPDDQWTAERLTQLMKDYRADHQQLLLTPAARNLRHTYVVPAEDRRTWRVQQMLVDPDGHNDWVAEFEVDLVQSRAGGQPALRLRRLGPLA